MQRCPACSRHVWETERRCPFCATPLRAEVASAPLVISALVGLTMIACVGDDMSGETTAGTSESATSSATGTDSVSSTSGTTASTTATSTDGTASTSTSTSTSSTTSTSTGSESTSSSSDTMSTSSGTTEPTTTSTSTTTNDTSTTTNDTSSTTTSPECNARGEQMCEGICVNILDDDDNCGKCGNVCEEQGAVCYGGECVVILPYGAPMPEPLWA